MCNGTSEVRVFDAPRNDGSISKHLAILHGTSVLGHLIVENTRLRIAGLRQPVHPAGAFRDKQILQITVIARGPARSVEEILDDAGQLAVDISAEQEHRLIRIMKSLPGNIAGAGRERGLVEGDIAVP